MKKSVLLSNIIITNTELIIRSGKIYSSQVRRREIQFVINHFESLNTGLNTKTSRETIKDCLISSFFTYLIAPIFEKYNITSGNYLNFELHDQRSI